MTMMPEPPGFLVYEHARTAPLGYARPGDDFGWFVMARMSRCVVNVRGPFATEADASAAGQQLLAAQVARRTRPLEEDGGPAPG
ncbi:MAG: hypothetical protein HW391_2031 [Chloroflexi bacterium]|nr:hypothetical protein [Chloroflexota bacterium]